MFVGSVENINNMNNTNVPDANRLAKICLQTFESIPKSGKPATAKEWTVLSCIAKYHHQTDVIQVVSIGTGKFHIRKYYSYCKKRRRMNKKQFMNILAFK